MVAPLLVASGYSFHYGCATPAELAGRAKALGYEALALADRDGLYGVPAFIESCEAEGLKPLIGAELSLDGGGPGSGRALAIAMDRAGFSRLCRLLSARAESGFDARAELLRDSVGLAVASDDDRLLGSPGSDGFYALLSPCRRGSWRRLLASGRRPLATGEVRFIEPGDRALQRLLVAIGSGRTVYEVRDDELSPEGATLVDPAGFGAAYAGAPEALAANEALVGAVSFRSPFDGFVFPRHGGPGEEKGYDPVAALRRLTLEGAVGRYGVGPHGTLPGRVTARIDYELEIIAEKGFADYFLVVRDIVRRASRSCGRGSAAASVVSYALGITDVDPIRHGLYFERFLNPGRADPPDIDVDFAWDERDGLLESVLAEYGEARAARVSNHVRFQARSALREAARAYGMPDGEISARERSAASADPGGAGRDAPRDGEWAEIARLAARLPGLPRHLGVHSGGVILVPDELASRVPVERSGSGIRVTAWDKDGVEAAGLVKIDLLGNRSLAVVRDALVNLEENGEPIDERAWRPIDDPGTIAMLARGDAMGVFYVESPAMRLLQKKTGRGDFEHLVIHSSIIRPAANRYISEYIDRLNGKPYLPLHPLIGDLLAESYGIMCYQEDVCKVAVALAGFSPAEADKVRKALSKKDAPERLAAYAGRFRDGALARGVDERTIAETWAMIESFSGYSFVKAHSASYAMLSFRSAYLRRHHPAEFMAAVISNRGGYYSTLAYVSEARRMGLRVLPPDVETSRLRCRGRGSELRLGLGMVSTLSSACSEAIVRARRAGGPFRSVDALARRARVGRPDAEALAGSGALDSLSPGMTRADKLARLLSLCDEGKREAGQGELFAYEPAVPGPARPPGSSGPSGPSGPGARKRLESELLYLGTTLAEHPLALWPKALSMPRALGRDLPRLVGRRVALIGWPITAKPVVTSGGEAMEFVSFEDETALYETVLFPGAFARYRHLLFDERPLIVRGVVEEDRTAVTVTVDSLERLG